MNKLTKLKDNKISFWCKGCNCMHILPVGKDDRVHWEFNGDFKIPTISPSIRVEHYSEELNRMVICHSFIIGGKIQYLSDCTHKFAGRTIELIDIKEG